MLAAPFPILQPQRTALAHWLVRHEFVTAGALVYQGAAWSQDAVAQNNFGVLKYRGLGVAEDRDAARRLFAASAASGSPQARTNLALVEGGGCGLNHVRSAASVERLAPDVASGNSGAATQTIDCLYFAAAKDRLSDPDGAMLDASRAISPTDGPARLKAGKALLNAARSIQLPGYGKNPSPGPPMTIALSACSSAPRSTSSRRPNSGKRKPMNGWASPTSSGTSFRA